MWENRFKNKHLPHPTFSNLSFLNILPLTSTYKKQIKPGDFSDDAKALRNDWEYVGRDIQTGINIFNKSKKGVRK